MNENNELSISIRARILPQIEGAHDLINQIDQLPSNINKPAITTIQDSTFQQGLSSRQMNRFEDITKLSDSYLHEQLSDRQEKITSNLDIDFASGHITPSMKRRNINDLLKQKKAIHGIEEDLLKELNERFQFKEGDLYTHEGVTGRLMQVDGPRALFMEPGKRHKTYGINLPQNPLEGIDPEKRELFTNSLKKGFEDAKDSIDGFINTLKSLPDQTRKTQTEISDLFERLKAAGVLTIAGTAINMGLDYWAAGQQIEAKERLSFDLNSPMGMYSAQKQYEAFKTTTERSRDYEIGGGIGGAAIGGIGALLLGASGVGIPAAILAGSYFGSSISGKIASGKNVETESEMQEQLKRRNEIYEQLNSMVTASSGYDVLRSRTRARIGGDSIGSLELGYLPEEELTMRTSFADARGRFDPQLYKEQTTFARAEGIDPNAIYQLNLSARMTGMDVGISGLDKAKQIAQATYGEGYSNQRVIDILSDIKKINEKLLQTNVDMDSRDALRISAIPNMIFGNDSPYGRLGEKGEDTIGYMDRLTKPSSLAGEAWLYSAYGVEDPLQFIEQQRKGLFDLSNLSNIQKKIQRDSGGNMRMAALTLEGLTNWPKDIPAGMRDEVVNFMLGEPVTKDSLDKKNAEWQKKFGKGLEDYQGDAGKAVSATEENREKLEKMAISLGDSFRGIVNKMSLDWLTEWNNISTTTKNRIILESQLNEILKESIARFKQFFLDGGGKPGSEEDQYKKGKGRGRLEGPPIPEGDALEEIRNKEKAIQDAHGRDATGFVKERMLKLREELSESSLGMRYRVGLIEGFDPTCKGHAPGSPHYNNLAMDTDLYDKFAHKKITKGNYPSEIKNFYSDFAKREGLEYGGDWTKPDENHFQDRSYKRTANNNSEIDYDRIGTAVANALSRQPQEHQPRIIVEDRTREGISISNFERASKNANSVFRAK